MPGIDASLISVDQEVKWGYAGASGPDSSGVHAVFCRAAPFLASCLCAGLRQICLVAAGRHISCTLLCTKNARSMRAASGDGDGTTGEVRPESLLQVVWVDVPFLARAARWVPGSRQEVHR
eukprot:5049372-Pleurochrysis_carterae.AAC.3